MKNEIGNSSHWMRVGIGGSGDKIALSLFIHLSDCLLPLLCSNWFLFTWIFRAQQSRLVHLSGRQLVLRCCCTNRQRCIVAKGIMVSLHSRLSWKCLLCEKVCTGTSAVPFVLIFTNSFLLSFCFVIELFFVCDCGHLLIYLYSCGQLNLSPKKVVRWCRWSWC